MYSVKVFIRTRDTHVMPKKKGKRCALYGFSATGEDREVLEELGRQLERTTYSPRRLTLMTNFNLLQSVTTQAGRNIYLQIQHNILRLSIMMPNNDTPSTSQGREPRHGGASGAELKGLG